MSLPISVVLTVSLLPKSDDPLHAEKDSLRGESTKIRTANGKCEPNMVFPFDVLLLSLLLLFVFSTCGGILTDINFHVSFSSLLLGHLGKGCNVL